MRSKHENVYIKCHIININKTHLTNSTKNTQTIYEHHILKSQQKPKNQEIKGYKHEMFWEK